VKTPPFDPHNTAVDLARTLEDPQHGSESFRAEQEDDSPVLRGMRGRRIKTATTPPTLATHEVDRRFVEEVIRLGDPEWCTEISCVAGKAGTRGLDKARLQGRAEKVLQVAQEQRDIPTGSQLDFKTVSQSAVEVVKV